MNNPLLENKKLSYDCRSLVAAPSIGSIDAYINWAKHIPMLSAEQELELANKFREDGDLEAARQLVVSHLRFVVHVVKGYQGYGLSQSDLIQEGTVGLMKAVRRFDPNVGVRLVSFAVHWIKAEIHEFVLRNWRIVKIATTKAQRKLFFNLRKANKKLNWFSNEEVLHVAKELKVDPKDVRAMEARMGSMDVSFDGYSSNDGSEKDACCDPIQYLEADSKDPADEVASYEVNRLKSNRLAEVLSSLDLRSKEILEARWLSESKVTLHELAEKYGVSAERIRQIEEGAIKKLKKEMVS